MKLLAAQTPRFKTATEGTRWVKERAERADLLVLPEYWIGTSPLSEDDFEKYVDLAAELAASIGGVVVAGAVAAKIGDVVKNVCPVVAPRGLVAVGEKIYPSAATGERDKVAPGENLVLFKVGEWTVGCLICVDLVYPELARALALAGAELLVNPASIPGDRSKLWAALGAARAFENSMYVAAALGTGYQYADGRIAAGGSYVATPDGDVETFGEAPGVYSAALDREAVHKARRRRRYLEDVGAARRSFKIVVANR